MLYLAIKRLRHNFQLSIITLMGFIAVFTITPYAVYRFYTESFITAVADTVAVVSIIIAVIYAWRTGNAAKPGIYLAIICSAAATIAAVNSGINSFFWIYPLVLFNFFMVPPSRALSIMLIVLSSIAMYHILKPNTVFASNYQMSEFLVTCLLSSLLTFIFAYRTQHQRERLEVLAAHDPLTGIYNRRIMTDELNKAVHDNRNTRAYSLLIMDLDHFKNINDTLGHEAGDQVLIDFVHIVQKTIRKNDLFFRHGGEEFALLLPDTNKQGLTIVADKLQKQVFSNLQSQVGSVSVSSGGAVLNENENWQDWLNRADAQLYLSKQSGRNRYHIAD